MSKVFPACRPWDDPALRNTTLAELFEFYDRRGYDLEMGRGERPAVVVIDFSIGFTQGTADFAAGEYSREVEQTRRLLDAGRGRAPIYFTTIAYDPDMRDAGLWVKKLGRITALQKGSRAVEIDERLAVRPDEPVIVKKYPSAFFGTDFQERLERDGVDTLIIAGCTTSACVRATAVDSMQRGFKTLLAAEAINDITPLMHAIHLRDLGGRYADVVSVDDLVTYLDGLQPWAWNAARRAIDEAAPTTQR